jgi:hypothetical protein
MSAKEERKDVAPKAFRVQKPTMEDVDFTNEVDTL